MTTQAEHPQTVEGRQEDDIAAYAAWRRDPNRLTADAVQRDDPDLDPTGEWESRIWTEHPDAGATR